jgi:hypothetical protein
MSNKYISFSKFTEGLSEDFVNQMDFTHHMLVVDAAGYNYMVRRGADINELIMFVTDRELPKHGNGLYAGSVIREALQERETRLGDDFEKQLTEARANARKSFQKGISFSQLPCGCTSEGSPVFFNPLNGVVQCHKCGSVYSSLPAPEPFKPITWTGDVATPTTDAPVVDIGGRCTYEAVEDPNPFGVEINKGMVHKEVDPFGKTQHDIGAKLDAGKPRFGLLMTEFANAMLEICKVGTYGAAKYTDSGWKNVPNGESRYMDALYRHLNKRHVGEVDDLETGLPHLAHAAWDAICVLELELRKREASL